ncbi:MAG: hypothetical protein ACPGO5_04830 [Patescibacteria group bacterium]
MILFFLCCIAILATSGILSYLWEESEDKLVTTSESIPTAWEIIKPICIPWGIPVFMIGIVPLTWAVYYTLSVVKEYPIVIVFALAIIGALITGRYAGIKHFQRQNSA